MSGTISSSELGKLFDKYLENCLRDFSIINEKDIKNIYGKHITTIDLSIKHENTYFFIQNKFKQDKEPLNNIKAFVDDCNRLKDIIEYNDYDNRYTFHYIYLSRICVTESGKNVLEEKNGNNIFLYNTSTIIENYSFNDNKKDFDMLLFKFYEYIKKYTNNIFFLKEYEDDEDDILMCYT